MALTRCEECGREVSSKAAACPHCGAPISGMSIASPEFHGRGEGVFMKSMNCGCVVLIAIVVMIVIAIILLPAMASTR
jgi:uncharacterized membrane protein YvbJ